MICGVGSTCIFEIYFDGKIKKEKKRKMKTHFFNKNGRVARKDKVFIFLELQQISYWLIIFL